jgi:hypothetical protein
VVHRVAIVVQAADGSGLIASLSGANADFGFAVEQAGPGDLTPLACGSNNSRPRITSSSVTGSSATIGLQFAAPLIYSDCDPGTFGAGVGACNDNFAATKSVAVGQVFTSVQPCLARPDTSLPATGSKWVNTGVADGSVTATITVALPATANDCLYIGGTTRINGNLSSGITGYVAYKGTNTPLPASPTAENVRVARAAGKINVSWETLSEVGLAGFKLVGVGHKGEFQVGSFVNAKGTASKYSVTLSISDFKGNKGVKVISVLTDGTTLSSPLKNF